MDEKEKGSVVEVTSDNDYPIESTDLLFDLFLETKQYPAEQLDADSRRVRIKTDVLLLPILMFTYLLSFLDKQTLNYSNAYGLQADNNMTSEDYSWVASAANFGYLIAAYPFNFILQRYPVGKTLTGLVFIWGMICMATAGVHNFTGLFIARFFLGMVEAVIAPACMAITAMFYKRDEQSMRMSLWLGVNGIASILGGLLSWGCGHASAEIAPWKLIYLVVGTITVVWSGVLVFLLPDSPKNAKMFTHYEKVVIMHRISKNGSGAKNKEYKRYQIKEAFMDPKSYFLWSIQIALGLLNGGVTNFQSSLFKGFGFTGLQSTKLQMVGGAIELVSCVAFGLICNTIPHTILLCISLAAIPGLGGLIGITKLPLSKKYSLAACCWIQNSFGASIILSWSLPSINLSGHTKKSAVLGFNFVLYAASNITSPHFFYGSDSPRYWRACIGLMICYGWLIACPIAFAGYLFLVNRSRDKKGYAVIDREEVLAGFEDKTDFENKGFRYLL
ncbi:hypothetical protein OGAPHI_000567 [Ogataea philodendri]|uniref:Major facilitator superfamily (MFS) profile domain-containing protein n=1 Tax=Ogataea philodendri TaxID=1378263 RepID=A0A9P8TA86_9ASCO|nr:uncharacterized protein OGAPHI_000567 [Ogataea philodendri]KAH3671344.1 hypothetical protein OGAPHI_000567 [Ogataea philodendri]